MIHLDCREHLPCAPSTSSRPRAGRTPHRELTRARDENAELRRRLGEVGA